MRRGGSAVIRVQHIRVIEDHAGNPVVLLSDPETGMELPIWIGEVEAFAIQRELEGVQLPRPMTHDLMRNILVELGVEFATLVLRWNGRTFFIDARPSDSIALAVRMNAPVYVAEEVAKAAGYFPQPSRKEIERFMRLIKDVELPEM